MKIGIVGLGLIGGSLAKAIQAQGGHTVYGADADPAVLAAARATGAVAAPLTDDNLAECELLALALFGPLRKLLNRLYQGIVRR